MLSTLRASPFRERSASGPRPSSAGRPPRCLAGLCAAAALAATVVVAGCSQPPADALDRPAVAEGEVRSDRQGAPDLAVVLVIDQLTPDVLDRYDAAWQGGFRRLLDEGHVFTDAVHDHAITFTSPGHASPTTGVVPARHGIVSNSWREWRDGDWITVSSVADPDSDLVGGSGSGSSSRNLLVDGLPDWILAHDSEARVVSLSGKSTAGVLMAGRAPEADDRRHVYWFSVGNEGFVTSTHYRDALPDWVEDFNPTVVERFASERCWETGLPDDIARMSRRDTVDYELDGVHIHFPHCQDDERFRSASHFLSRTPALDAATLALGEEAVRALALGHRGAPDYLSLALSSTDRVGHDYGPYSREQLANLTRLDRELGRFLEFLDDHMGDRSYVVALTSDHGVLPLPEHRVEQGEFGLRLLSSDLNDAVEEAASGLGPVGPEVAGSSAAEDRAVMAERLEQVEWIDAAFPLEVLASDDPVSDAAADAFVTLYRKSFHPERLTSRMARWGVEPLLTEGALVLSTGTTHGVPYLHDRHVPLLFSGAGLEAGRNPDPAYTVDLAPTLAAILEVPIPDGLDGRALFPR